VIELDGRVARGDFTAEVTLEVAPGEVVGVIGENGSGKSTLLRVLAGLTPLDDGRLALDGTVVDEPGAGTFVDPDHRPAGVVLQEPTLFPHLDLRDNVAFGPRRAGTPKADARAAAEGWLDRLGVGAHARSRPGEVSGGQAQRAAIARTLARDPAVLLLDEPFTALDQDGRTLVRRLLRTELRRPDRAIVLVSHDPVDALALTDRLVVLEDGRVSQTATPAEIARRPRSAFVARLVGLNLLEGRAEGTTVTLADRTELVTATAAAGEVLVTIPPHAVALYRARPDGSPRNTWERTVEDLEAVGDRVRVALAGPVPLVAEVTPAAVADLGLVPGDRVWAIVKATEIEVYSA
jgi:molybdate transport system ATP-binding protein